MTVKCKYSNPCSIVKNTTVSFHDIRTMICSSYAYIYVMVHSTCKYYLFLYFWHVLKNVPLLDYYFIHCLIMCNVFVMCNLSSIDNSMQSITGHLLLNFFPPKYFSFCILLIITWSTFIFFFKSIFCDSPVQLTSVLLCHLNILPVFEVYVTYFYLEKSIL